MSVKDKADAIDRFVRTLKSGGLYDDINAACIMAGWTNLAGALYPFKGAAPTNGGGLFQNADLDPGIGLKGDGSSKYLNSNRANNADGQDDAHRAVYISNRTGSSSGTNTYPCYYGESDTNGSDNLGRQLGGSDTFFMRSRSLANTAVAGASTVSGLLGISRSASASFTLRKSGQDSQHSVASQTPTSQILRIFMATGDASTYADATLSWYSIGSATDLAALDSAVSTLMADLRAIDEDGFDRDALAYLRAVEAADGSFLETGVKKAINRFIVGCKKDGTWDALKASCIMCGARTLAGALVPLKGTAPTPYNFVAGDYNRETGLKGDGSTKYLDSNRANNADPQEDRHLAIFMTEESVAGRVLIGSTDRSAPTSNIVYYSGGSSMNVSSQSSGFLGVSADFGSTSGSMPAFFGASRSDAAGFSARGMSQSQTVVAVSQATYGLNEYVFARNDTDGTLENTNARLAFYSIGSALDLAALDTRVTNLVSQIAAAIP